MDKAQQKIVNKFKKTQDYRDICYMIDHVRNEEVRISCIEALNYKIGTNILFSESNTKIKNVIIGRKGEIRVQITPKYGIIAACAIVDFKNTQNQ